MTAVIRRKRGVSRVNKPISPAATIRGEEHWTQKGADVRLFLWNKHGGDASGPAGRILFVHGSSMASQPTFDLQVPGRADSSVMDFFAARGYDTWCVDMEGYGRSTKTRDNNAPIAYCADDSFADAIIALDDSVPTGTYVDMCANLPVCDPEKIPVPTLIMRGEYDGIASFADLLKFFELLPNPDKQFAVMPGIAHASFHQKNYAICYHILESFFSQPAPIYRGGH